MRLLKQTPSGTFQLHDFPGGNSSSGHEDTSIPPYAILSHTWSRRGARDEVSFRDVPQAIEDDDDDHDDPDENNNPTGTTTTTTSATKSHHHHRHASSLPGYSKLLYCASQARRDGLEYFWVDTCCIDKSSSAELSESLNSMFRWYRNAARCYAYLEDVSLPSSSGEGEVEGGKEEEEEEGDVEVVVVEKYDDDDDEGDDWALLDRRRRSSPIPLPDREKKEERGGEEQQQQQQQKKNENESSTSTSSSWRSSFRSSRWFTRGWTLQELLAPREVVFYSSEWTRLGDRTSLESEIHAATGIPVSAFLRKTPLARFEVRERMAWAQGRVTRREEDKAYSLLGIFGVYMPMIYGEGERAAMRRLYRTIRDGADDVDDNGGGDFFGERGAGGGGQGRAVLGVGNRLQRFQSMRSPNGRVSLRLEEDGNMVLRGGGGLGGYGDDDYDVVLWASHTLGRRDAAYLEMQGDGNLVLYTRWRGAIWATGTVGRGENGKSDSELRVEDEGDASVYRDGVKVWTTLTSGIPQKDLLWVNKSLVPGEFLISDDERFCLTLQQDGDITLDGPTGRRWSSGTAGRSDVEELIMQGDGNLVLYVTGHDPIWDSGSRAGARPVLVMQNDGNLVIYACGEAIWATHTN